MGYANSAVIFFIFSFWIQTAEPRKLLLAHVLWRHGDRSPVRSIPSDTGNGPSSWPQGALGELTAEGMQQEFLLGQQLKARYDSLGLKLSSHTVATQTHVRSSDVNRTLMSAYSNFAGTIQGTTANNSNTRPVVAEWPTNWQPIPVHTVPTPIDFLLRPDTYCPTVDWQYRTHVWNSPEWVNRTRKNKDFLSWAAQQSGLMDLSLGSIWQIEDPLFVEKLHGHTWPSWVNQSVYNKIQHLTKFGDSQLFHYPKIARLRGGPLLRDIIQRMQFKVACLNANTPSCTWINGIQYYTYSAHDTTVMPLLETLARDDVGNQTGATSLTGGGLPRFCAAVAIDLFQEKEGKFTVDVHYKNYYAETTFLPVPVSGSNGSCKNGTCTLSEFIARSEPFVPVDYLQECGVTSLEEIGKINYLDIRSPWKPVSPQIQTKGLSVTKAPKSRQLVMAHLLWRHGDRTPVRLIPTDTANNITTWFQGMLGELTPAGMREHFVLGRQLSNRYAGWVNPQNIATQMYIRSTDYNRTLMSAYANLAGMFVSQNGLMKPNVSNWPSQWQPMPVHTVPLANDNLLWWPNCSSAEVIKRQEVWKSPAWTNIVKAEQSFLDFLSNKSGVHVTLDQMYTVSDPLYFENAAKTTHKMPSWVSSKIYNRIMSLKAVSDRFLFHHPELARLKGGTLLGEIVSRMVSKVKCMQSTSESHCRRFNINTWKYYVYSAHDLTVMALLETLARKDVGNLTGAAALTGGGLPYTASCLAIDLYQEIDGSFTVEIGFKNDYQSTKFVPVPVNGGCETGKCSLTTFQQRSLPFIPLNWQYECNHAPPPWPPITKSHTSTQPTSTTKGSQSATARCFTVTVTVVLLVCTTWV